MSEIEDIATASLYLPLVYVCVLVCLTYGGGIWPGRRCRDHVWWISLGIVVGFLGYATHGIFWGIHRLLILFDQDPTALEWAGYAWVIWLFRASGIVAGLLHLHAVNILTDNRSRWVKHTFVVSSLFLCSFGAIAILKFIAGT
jgi:hypothetical protein